MAKPKGRIKRYLVDFTASTGGTVMVTGRNQKEALKNLRAGECNISDQIDDQMYEMKSSEFDYSFDERSIVEDEDECGDPYTDYDGPDEEE